MMGIFLAHFCRADEALDEFKTFFFWRGEFKLAVTAAIGIYPLQILTEEIKIQVVLSSLLTDFTRRARRRRNR